MNQRLILMFSLSALLAGCATHQSSQPLPRASYCEADELTVVTACTEMSTVNNDATFGVVVDALHNEQETIRRCTDALNTMRQSLAACNRNIDEYNKTIDEINQKNQQQPWWLRFKQAFLKPNTDTNIDKD